LVIGSGPIVIGQASEFDYSGTQACKVLKQEGYRVVLVNSNPATIMTDPEVADRTYVEPLDPSVLAAIIARERPDALLPTLGGQTALNLAMQLWNEGVLDQLGVELIGAKAEAISTAEDRERFKAAMSEIGLGVPPSGFAHSVREALTVGNDLGYPLIVRPSFILGGAGSGIAATESELEHLAREGLEASPIGEILIEASIAGWKEYELEVMRDLHDNCVVVCSIENFDPMGVHTGDSITVAPAQTLSDVEYQRMRDAAFACIRRVGVETGGSNIQFAVNPQDGEMLVIEMNPRVSRSSALASKATGFPIAKIAAKLAVGYSLDEIANDITGVTPASFEPTIDYVVTKVPRWAFEKLPGAKDLLGTKMKSVGEVMAIGRTFVESLQKALRSLEQGRWGLNCDPAERLLYDIDDDTLLSMASLATPERVFQIEEALRRGIPIERVGAATGVDPWFLEGIAELSRLRSWFLEQVNEHGGVDNLERLDRSVWKKMKRAGFSDAQLAWLLGVQEEQVRSARSGSSVFPTFKTVDTCAGEFEAHTPYHFSTYEDEDEIRPSSRPRVIVLGAGPNRIGQGIEFDYCCVHASMALSEAGYETVMINCNPETVSTDYDSSDRLYFEPIVAENVLSVIEAETRASRDRGSVVGVIVSLGGQTPLKLASVLPESMVLGTSPESIDIAEDRRRWASLCADLGIPQPPSAAVASMDEALSAVERIGYPVLVRPSYVLGGRAMQIVFDEQGLRAAIGQLGGFLMEGESGHANFGALGREGGLAAERPALIDRFLEDAVEVDVDAVRDHTGDIFIAGVMEHVEEAGIHSGDSACMLPPVTLPKKVVETIEDYTRLIADALSVKGPINVQYAVKDGAVFVIEANPRASRTIPFVAKATGVPVAKVAARVIVGATLAELRSEGLLPAKRGLQHVSVKEAVLPFSRFPEVDSLLGPEMRSTGEVMGIDSTFGLAFAKSQMAAGNRLPDTGTVFFSLADKDKKAGMEVARQFKQLGFNLVATVGTARHLNQAGIPVDAVVAKVTEGAIDALVANDHSASVRGSNESMTLDSNPPSRSSLSPARPVPDPSASLSEAHGAYLDAVELISSGKVQLVINTPQGRGARADGLRIRSAAQTHRVPCLTTLAAARAAAEGIEDWRKHGLSVRALQDYHHFAG